MYGQGTWEDDFQKYNERLVEWSRPTYDFMMRADQENSTNIYPKHPPRFILVGGQESTNRLNTVIGYGGIPGKKETYPHGNVSIRERDTGCKEEDA